MVVLGKLIVVFGGFQDNNRSRARFFNDVHVFDLETYEHARTCQMPTCAKLSSKLITHPPCSKLPTLPFSAE